jgi:hypothetical protein
MSEVKAWLKKGFVFGGPVLLAAVIRAILIVAGGGPELALYDADKVKFFDVSLDLLLAGFAILLGLLLFVNGGNTVNKPGTNEPILVGDLIVCFVVQLFALIGILFSSIIGPHFVPAMVTTTTIWIPDALGVGALLWSMWKLA